MSALADHLAGGIGTTARAWAVTRRDGLTMGFTDHDVALTFEGITFRPDTGLSAPALVQATGLSVDNTEVLGALSDAAITEADLEAGRFDGAEVRMWLVNWADVALRKLRFRGNLGEIRRGEGAFQAELRGLTEKLNQPRGRVYHKDCAAVLGDASCRFDLGQPGYRAVLPAETVEGDRVFRFALLDLFTDRWFERGRLKVTSGAAAGLEGIVKTDRLEATGARRVELWAPIPAPVLPGDGLILEAGCDKRAATCRLKFNNIANFQGFPHIPGDDWMIAGPRAGGAT